MAQLNSLIVTGDSRFLNTINGNITSTNAIHRATMETSSTATAFVLTADGIDSLYDGLIITCKNTKIASASGCTINLNGLGAKSIWLSQNNSACTTHWGLNHTYFFIYDGANSRWELQQGRDTNSTYNFSGTTFYSGNSGNATHDANAAVKNGNYYYSSNGPSTTLGATTNDGGLYVQSHSDTWVGQIAQDYRDGDIFIRGKNNGTWSDWKKPDAGTVNGYTVAKSVPSNAVFTDHTYSGTGLISVNSSGVISTTAEANQNAFSNVKVGSTTVAADSKTDTLELVGSNVTLTPDATNDKVTIGITKSNVTTALGYTPPTANNNVTQTADDSTASAFEVLFSNTADNTTRTEAARKSSKLKFQPSSGNLSVTSINNISFAFITGAVGQTGDTSIEITGTGFNSVNSIIPLALPADGKSVGISEYTVTDTKITFIFSSPLTSVTNIKALLIYIH